MAKPRTPYGFELIMDLHDCDALTFNRSSLRKYFIKMCKAIDMKRCELYFWDDVGVPAKEKHFLINPENYNPEDFIGFEWYKAYGTFVKAIGLDPDDRGDRTIKITGINEGTILEERASLVKDLEGFVDTMKWALREDKPGAIKRTAKIIKQMSSSDNQFAGFRRAFFIGNGLGDYIAND